MAVLNGNTTAAIGGRPGRNASPLPTSLAILRQLRLAALRWVVAGAAILTATIFVLRTPTVSGSPTIPDACVEIMKSTSMLQVWVAVATFRIVLGASFRVLIWFMFDTLYSVDQQLPAIYFLVRSEFVLMLLSVMWTTIG